MFCSKYLAVASVLLCMTEAGKNYYEILGLPPSATGRQIKQAFYKKAMKYHPDKNNHPDSEAVFREIADGEYACV